MASSLSKLPPPPLYSGERQPLLIKLQKATLAAAKGRQGRVAISTKATGDDSESSISLTVIESVQKFWDKSEDRYALIGLGFAAIVAAWASANLITAIDKLPLIPTVLELVGILFSSWFVYRYLLFKPDREELICTINKSVADVLGQ